MSSFFDPDRFGRPAERKLPGTEPDRELGGCLSLWLIAIIVGGILTLIEYVALSSRLAEAVSSVWVFAVLATVTAEMICAIALLSRKRWGAQGLFFAFAASLALKLLVGVNPTRSCLTFLGSAGFGLYLLRDKWDYLD